MYEILRQIFHEDYKSSIWSTSEN